MGLRKLGLCFFLLNSYVVYCQYDTTYIRKFPEKITVRLGIQNTSNQFTNTYKDTGEQVEYIPNDKTYLGVSVLFRSLEVDLGYAPNFLSENKDNKDSKLFTLNLRMFQGRWMQTFDFYRQKGFFVAYNEESISVPELISLKIGGKTSFIFNRRFSFRAIGFQNEWQKKSVGSFIPSLTYYYTKFSLDDPDVSTSDATYNMAIGPGYYYNWVIRKHFIVSGGLTVGFGANFTRSEGKTYSSGLAQVLSRIVLGYNSERFFIGTNLNAQVLVHNADENSSFDDAISFTEVYIGYRFNAPKKWVEKADQFNRKFGLD